MAESKLYKYTGRTTVIVELESRNTNDMTDSGNPDDYPPSLIPNPNRFGSKPVRKPPNTQTPSPIYRVPFIPNSGLLYVEAIQDGQRGFIIFEVDENGIIIKQVSGFLKSEGLNL